MATKFAKLAKDVQDTLAVTVVEPGDCETAGKLIEALQAWTAVNCPIAQPPELIPQPAKK